MRKERGGGEGSETYIAKSKADRAKNLFLLSLHPEDRRAGPLTSPSVT